MASQQEFPLSPPLEADKEHLNDFSEIIQRNLRSLFDLAHEHTNGNLMGSRTLFAQTTHTTVTNSTAELSCIGSGVGSYVIPANTLKIGDTIRVTARGGYSTGAGPGTWRVRIKIGGTVVFDTGNETPAGSESHSYFEVTSLATIRTIGINGTVDGEGCLLAHKHPSGIDMFDAHSQVSVLIDTTKDARVELTMQWGTAATTNSFDTHVVTIEKLTVV